MGSAYASGVDRARIAAEAAVASPLLEGVNLSGARGVLVNITACDDLKMREVNEVMNTVRGFAAEDATIIFGAVYDDTMSDNLRVTVVATGLGQPQMAQKAKLQPQLVVNRTGTDAHHHHHQHHHPLGATPVDYGAMESSPAVFRRNRASAIEALQQNGVDKYDIPAFLRKQAD
jgi:cell division protein FtsZ